MPTDTNYCLEELVDQGNPREIYNVGKKIGSGAFGAVFEANNLQTGKKVAIKEMVITEKELNAITNEIAVMKASAHENIVEYEASYFIDDNLLWMVIEFMDGGSVTDVLEAYYYDQDFVLDEPVIASICYGVR